MSTPRTMTADRFEQLFSVVDLCKPEDRCVICERQRERQREMLAERAAHQQTQDRFIRHLRCVEAILGQIDQIPAIDNENYLVDFNEQSAAIAVNRIRETQAKLAESESKVEITRIQIKDSYYRVSLERDESLKYQAIARELAEALKKVAHGYRIISGFNEKCPCDICATIAKYQATLAATTVRS